MPDSMQLSSSKVFDVSKLGNCQLQVAEFSFITKPGLAQLSWAELAWSFIFTVSLYFLAADLKNLKQDLVFSVKLQFK